MIRSDKSLLWLNLSIISLLIFSIRTIRMILKLIKIKFYDLRPILFNLLSKVIFNVYIKNKYVW